MSLNFIGPCVASIGGLRASNHWSDTNRVFNPPILSQPGMGPSMDPSTDDTLLPMKGRAQMKGKYDGHIR